jgi:hypothetical protein
VFRDTHTISMFYPIILVPDILPQCNIDCHTTPKTLVDTQVKYKQQATYRNEIMYESNSPLVSKQFEYHANPTGATYSQEDGELLMTYGTNCIICHSCSQTKSMKRLKYLIQTCMVQSI